MPWWGWMVLGAILFGAELVAVDAQFYLVFMGLSAFIVGAAGLVGLAAMPEWAQWAAFAFLSLVSMFAFRKNLYEKIRGGAPGFRDLIVGEEITVEIDLAPGGEGRSEFRGSDWTVRNVGSTSIQSGSKARIVKTKGLILHVSAD